MLYIKSYPHQGISKYVVAEITVLTLCQVLNRISLISYQIFHFTELAGGQLRLKRLRKALSIVLVKEGFDHGSKGYRWF